MWQDFADDLGYAARCILTFGDSAQEAPKTMANYDVWLVQTERRAPVGQNEPRSGR